MVVTRGQKRRESPSGPAQSRVIASDATVAGQARGTGRRPGVGAMRPGEGSEANMQGIMRPSRGSAPAPKRKLTCVQTVGGDCVNAIGNPVDATIQRGTASPTSSTSTASLEDGVADVRGYLGMLPRETVEQILGYLEPKELAMMDMTCRYFIESGITDQVARHHLKNVARAKGLSPMTEKGESSLMLLDFVQGQSAAAAQGTAVAMGTYHTMCLMSEEAHDTTGRRIWVPTRTNIEEGPVQGRGATMSTSRSSSASTSDQPELSSYGIYSFGRGFHGQLGTGGHAPANLPTRVSQVEKTGAAVDLDQGDGIRIRLAVVHAGSSHSMAISRRGELFTWGLSSSGELGHGTWSPTEVSIPKLVTSFGKTRIVSVCAGSNHTLAISEAGQLWSCGRNRHGQLGQGHMMDEAAFFMVDSIRNHRIVSVAAGKFHSMALASDGKLFTWGDNTGGQLGLPNLTDHPTPTLVDYLDPESLRSGARVTSIAAGGYHSFALTVSGQLMATGRHKEGQLGIGSSSTNGIKKFREVCFKCGDASVRVIQVQCGYLHSLALLHINGRREVRSCGDNSFGQLGLDYHPINGIGPRGIFIGHPHIDTFRTVNVGKHMKLPKHGAGGHRKAYTPERITCIASGDWHSGAITEAGKLLTWGRGDCGQLGHGNDVSYWQPELMRWEGSLRPSANPDDKLEERPYVVVHPDRTLRRRKMSAKEAVVLTSPPPQPKSRATNTVKKL